MIKLLLVTSTNDALTAFLVSIFDIVLAIISCSLIRTWIYSKAFQGFSKSKVKKIRKKASLFSKISLLYLWAPKTTGNVNMKIAFYWSYLVLTFACIVSTALSWQNNIIFYISGALFFFLRAIDVFIWVLWVISGKKTF